MEKNVQALTREDLAAASEAFRAERADLEAKNAAGRRGNRAAARVYNPVCRGHTPKHKGGIRLQ